MKHNSQQSLQRHSNLVDLEKSLQSMSAPDVSPTMPDQHDDTAPNCAVESALYCAHADLDGKLGILLHLLMVYSD